MSTPIDERRTIVNQLAEPRVTFYALDVKSSASADYQKWKQLLDEIRRLERLLADSRPKLAQSAFQEGPRPTPGSATPV